MGIIYSLKNKLNGKCYVGQTTQSVEQRLSKHMSAARCDSTQLIHKAMRKYGIKSFHIEILGSYQNQKELNVAETKFIEELNSMVPNGYNLKTGGHNTVYSEESRLKMSLSHIGKKLSEEHRLRISKGCKGLPGPWQGKKLSSKHRNSISEGNKGNKHSKSTKKKLSAAKIGPLNPMYGKTGKDNPNSKVILLERPDGKIEKFDSLTNACIKYNLDIRNLSAVFTGKRKSHKGFKIWKRRREL
jgi:group I intron endonuclease